MNSSETMKEDAVGKFLLRCLGLLLVGIPTSILALAFVLFVADTASDPEWQLAAICTFALLGSLLSGLLIMYYMEDSEK